MSRPLVRKIPPADDDLEPTTEEEKRKLAEAAPGTTKQSPTLPQASPPARSPAAPQGSDPHAADRAAYFSGRYSPAGSEAGQMSPEMIADRRIAEFDLPASLRHCVADLIHILRDHDLGAALAALHNDPAIDKKYEGLISRLLVAVDGDDRRSRA